MNLLMDIWLNFGCVVYWIAWLGSVAIGIASLGMGILIGLAAWLIWAVVLQIMHWIEYKEWIWEWIWE